MNIELLTKVRRMCPHISASTWSTDPTYIPVLTCACTKRECIFQKKSWWTRLEEYPIYSECMPRYAFNYFEKWFDPEKFNWNHIGALRDNCQKYTHLWDKPEYPIIWHALND